MVDCLIAHSHLFFKLLLCDLVFSLLWAAIFVFRTMSICVSKSLRAFSGGLTRPMILECVFPQQWETRLRMFALNCCMVHTAEGRRASQQVIHQVKREPLELPPLESHHVMQEKVWTIDASQPTNAPGLGCQRGLRELQPPVGTAC